MERRMSNDEKRLGNWFKLEITETSFIIDKQAPGFSHHRDEIKWEDIIRVCFKSADGMFDQDEIYIFIKKQKESFVIPMEADGASKLWGELINQNLFDADLAIKAVTSSGELFVWPPEADQSHMTEEEVN